MKRLLNVNRLDRRKTKLFCFIFVSMLTWFHFLPLLARIVITSHAGNKTTQENICEQYNTARDDETKMSQRIKSYISFILKKMSVSFFQTKADSCEKKDHCKKQVCVSVMCMCIYMYIHVWYVCVYTYQV